MSATESKPIARRKAEEDRRSKAIPVRFSQDELAQLEAKLEEFGGRRSDYIRQAALGAKIQSQGALDEHSAALRFFAAVMNRINANLNMVAKYANTYLEDADKIKILTELLEIERSVAKIESEVVSGDQK